MSLFTQISTNQQWSLWGYNWHIGKSSLSLIYLSMTHLSPGISQQAQRNSFSSELPNSPYNKSIVAILRAHFPKKIYINRKKQKMRENWTMLRVERGGATRELQFADSETLFCFQSNINISNGCLAKFTVYYSRVERQEWNLNCTSTGCNVGAESALFPPFMQTPS